MSQANMRDRAPRFDIRLSAELKIENARLTGTTRNLSIGGVCVEVDRPIGEGKQLGLTLFIVEEDIEAEGDRGYAIGIRFADMTAQQKTALNNALRAMGEPTG